jgi:succinate dehydrogenase (ubiquinone) cytochrome b560 subunit
MPGIITAISTGTNLQSKLLGFYVGALSYLALPALGYNFDTSAIVASVASLPVIAKVGIKTTVAFPFVFHCLNGIRHLVSTYGTDNCHDVF